MDIFRAYSLSKYFLQSARDSSVINGAITPDQPEKMNHNRDIKEYEIN
jgi:hypothetical protein